MSHIRYYVRPTEEGWSVTRGVKPIGVIAVEADADKAAAEAAAIDRVRGHTVEVIKQDGDGRWNPCETHLSRTG